MSDTGGYTVGDLIAEFLESYGIDAAFGVISIHNMPILDAIGRRGKVRFVMSRGEAGACNMADAYARVRGQLGVCITSTGTGAGNAAGALVEAETAGTPLLHITGQINTPFLDKGWGFIHEAKDQPGMLAAISKAFFRINDPEKALDILREAAAVALTPPRGPVSVELPVDVQAAEISRPAEIVPKAVAVPPPDVTSLDQLAAMLGNAKRPIIWVGGGAVDAGDAIMRLVDKGVGVVASVHGRGIVADDHPLSLGAYGATPPTEAFYQDCDLCVVVGSKLRGHETRNYTLPLPSPLVRIDADPAANGRAYDNDLFVLGDASDVLNGVADRLDGGPQIDNSYATELAAARDNSVAQLRDNIEPYTPIVDALREAMPRDAVWVRDITVSNSTWGNRLVSLFSARDGVYALGGGIGQGLAMAVGAAVGATNRKVALLSGDGGFLLNIGELTTAVQENTDIAVVLMNDGGYGVIRNIQDAQYGGRSYFNDLHLPDFGDLAKSIGLPRTHVTAIDAFPAAIKSAIDHPGPALVEIDMAAIGAYKVRFGGPPTPVDSKS